MVVEASPASTFEMPEPDLLLEVVIVTLNAPAQLGGVDQIAKRDFRRERREPIFGPLAILLAAILPLDILRVGHRGAQREHAREGK